MGAQWAERTGLVVGLAVAALGQPVAGADRPNIVLIVADDLGFADVGYQGRNEWATPNLDRLAARGLVLDRCYAAAPICGPSRAAC